MADEYESISDYLATLLKLELKRRKSNLSYSATATQELLELHDRTKEYVQLVNRGVKENRPENLVKAKTEGDTLTHLIKETRERHLVRLSDGECPNPLASLIYTDSLSSYRKIRNHALNVAQAMAGEK
jgi:phosphate:Na+ symporter